MTTQMPDFAYSLNEHESLTFWCDYDKTTHLSSFLITSLGKCNDSDEDLVTVILKVSY